MRPADNIEKTIEQLQDHTTAEMDKRTLSDVYSAMDESIKSSSGSNEGAAWRNIMQNKITKFATAAIIIIAAIIGINHFGGSINVTSTALADVLEHVQRSTYSFDMIFKTVENGQITSESQIISASVLETGIVRFDSPGIGGVSTITDFSSGKSIVIFHRQKAATMMDEPMIKDDSGISGMYGLFFRSVSNLWDLRDGNEESLGSKELNGKKVNGFKVDSMEDAYFAYGIEIWAEIESSEPVLVEIVGKPFDNSYPTVNWTMQNFDLNVDLDIQNFRLEAPSGYTLTHQVSLEEMKSENNNTRQGEKVVQVLELWSNGSKKEAIETLLDVDWSAPIEFSSEQYIFTMTEKGYITLKANDQQKVIKKVMSDAGIIKRISKEAIRLGQTEAQNMNYQQAERYYLALNQLGELFLRNDEGMIIVQLVGVSVEKLALNEIIKLYTATNDMSKLQNAKNQLNAAESVGAEIKRKALGQ